MADEKRRTTATPKPGGVPTDARPPAPADAPAGSVRSGEPRPEPIRRRGWLEVRWRQLRRAPRPVVRAVASSLVVAVTLGIGYLAYDVALRRGWSPPGGDLRLAFAVAYVAGVLIAGTLVTWLIVPQPTRGGGRAVRSPWSAALGLFAAVPIAYLVLVVLLEVVRPLLG